MLNKLILIVLVGLLSFSLDAQSSRYGRRRSRQNTRQNPTVKEQPLNNASAKKQTGSTEKKQSSKKSAAQLASKFNKPALTLNYINSVLDSEIKKRLLESKLPAKLPGHKDDDEDTSEDDGKKNDGKKDSDEKQEKTTFISRLDFAILMSQYNALITNFELTEVTGIRPEWYQQYQTELRKFGPIINEMTIAVRARSSDRYAAGLHTFKEHQKACLKFLKTKPPRITKEQYQALWQKNTQIRRQNYLKRLQEEREAAMKRRQEQLKQLQQKNQPKNQGNQKTKQGTGR